MNQSVVDRNYVIIIGLLPNLNIAFVRPSPKFVPETHATLYEGCKGKLNFSKVRRNLKPIDRIYGFGMQLF